ncbi:MAG: transketolase family protein [Actinomycetia bacterium]|nr:transketolase family protein [Actinomycetes bacterium]
MSGGRDEKKATRAAYGETLIELAEAGLDVFAVEADLAGSTTTAKFAERYPARHINVGIAEQNMVGIAAGISLADAGKVVFTGSFAVFATGRTYDQIRNTVAYAQLNVNIVPTHAGISVGADGGSHQMVEDIALMRVLPNMQVLVPADYLSAKAAIHLAAASPGPSYVRLGREPLPQLYSSTEGFAFGRATVLRMGDAVSIIACGAEVSQALAAAELLAARGIDAEIIDAFSIKPLDGETILASLDKTGVAVTCEEHSVIGGLGEAVAALLAEHPGLLRKPLRRIGVQDRFGTSGDFNQLFGDYGLDAQAICRAVVE